MLDHSRALDPISAVAEGVEHHRSQRFPARAERAQRAWIARLGLQHRSLNAAIAAVGEPGSGPAGDSDVAPAAEEPADEREHAAMPLLRSPRDAERATRLGTALAHMARDLATVKRENTLLRRENAALRREIERGQVTPDERS